MYKRYSADKQSQKKFSAALYITDVKPIYDVLLDTKRKLGNTKYLQSIIWV